MEKSFKNHDMTCSINDELFSIKKWNILVEVSGTVYVDWLDSIQGSTVAQW